MGQRENDIEKRVEGVIVSHFGDAASVQKAAKILKRHDGHVKSAFRPAEIDCINIAIALETTFGIKISDQDAEAMGMRAKARWTVESTADIIRQKLDSLPPALELD